MSFVQRAAGMALALSALLVGGCAAPARPAASAEAQAALWTGRMALQVAENPGQSFSAAFELTGSARTGELKLFSPLGGTLALLSWAPGAATLRASGQTRQFDSVDQLAAQATGTPIPVTALFDWLDGVATAVPGWHTDLSQVAQGKLLARRIDPPPTAELRLAFDR